MSMSDIRIHRDFAVINDFVQVPPNRERDKARVSAADAMAEFGDSAQLVELSTGSGRAQGGKSGTQRIFRLPGLRPDESYGVNDPVRRLARF